MQEVKIVLLQKDRTKELEVLRKIKKENRKREVHRKIMFIMTSLVVISVTFALGIIVGRVLAYLYATGF